jgi:hypothetical protein
MGVQVSCDDFDNIIPVQMDVESDNESVTKVAHLRRPSETEHELREKLLKQGKTVTFSVYRNLEQN